MPTIYGGNAAQAINFGDGSGSITNGGPSVLYFSDRSFETVGGATGNIPVGESRQLTEVYWFWVPVGSRTDYSVSLLDPITGSGGDGRVGPPGPPGPPGPSGQDAVAGSDAIRGQTDRFYREIGGQLVYNGSTIIARNDAVSRAQNISQIVADSQKITVTHADLGPRAVVDVKATTSDDLANAGIRATARVADDLESTAIVLRQDRNLNDSLTNPADGSAWVREHGQGSPFTATGLTNLSSDFVTYTEGLANVAASWRMEEASGATLDDAIGANDGTVSGTVTYGVTGLMPSNTGDKAITTPGTATNQLTFPLAGITQAAFSVVMRASFPSSASIVLRDETGTGSDGYCFGSDGGSPAKLFYRNGSNAGTDQFVTNVLWADVADGEAHTFGWTKNGATTAFYVDGVQVHTAATAGSVALSTPWHVGKNGTQTPYSQETVSHLLTYSRALTAAEMTNVHNVAIADGLMHIAHTDVGTSRSSDITLTSQGALRPVLVAGSVTTTGFDVKFYDDAGALVTTANAGMAFGVSRDVRNVPVDPTALTVPVLVERVDAFSDSMTASSPFLWTRLGESSGSTMNDEVGTRDGTKTSGVTLGATGTIHDDADTGVTFDGSQGKIAFNDPELLGAFTMQLFFKRTGAGTTGATDFSTLVGWTSPSGVRRFMVGSDGSMLLAAGGQQIALPAATASNNNWHHFVYVWDGARQVVILDGVVIASNVTASVKIASAFWLGSDQDPGTNYMFKGDMDEFALWDRALTVGEVQQLWADATDGALLVDRASEAFIGVNVIMETFAPPPTEEPTQPAPTATALPDGDVGGAVSGFISLAPYRQAGLLDFGTSSPWSQRALPTDQPSRDAIELNGLPGWPLATSPTWVTGFCHLFGIDPVTGDVVFQQPGGQPLQGGNTPFYARVLGEFIYVVPDTQPYRTMVDRSNLANQADWSTAMNNVFADLGGVPMPADALPHFTADRYAFCFQPSTQTWFTAYSWIPQNPDITLSVTDERAWVTMELTGAPTNGGFFLEFDYIDHVNQEIQTFFPQAPILYNDTAAQVLSKVLGAKTASGIAFAPNGQRNFIAPVAAVGGPMNVAPVTLKFLFEQGLQPVAMRYTNNYMNAGGVFFTYKNADPWASVYLSSITSPLVAGDHVPAQSGPSGGTSAATGIDWMGMIIDWDEYNSAYETGLAHGWDAPGTDMGHIMAMSIGNCGISHVYPAIRGDGTLDNPDFTMLVEGALMTLPLDADASKVDPVWMPIFNTFKRYGIMPIDKTGGGCELIWRNPIWPGVTRPLPIPSTFQFSPGAYTAYMRQLPWHQMQIIDPAAVLAGW